MSGQFPQGFTTLEQFIVRAKQSTYVGGSRKLLPYRLGSKDLQFMEGDWAYHDSYLGVSDFIGQEIVYYQLKPVWGMNYFGVIIRPDKITASQAGQRIMKSLSSMYTEGRVLRDCEHQKESLRYGEQNTCDVRTCQRREDSSVEHVVAYEL